MFSILDIIWRQYHLRLPIPIQTRQPVSPSVDVRLQLCDIAAELLLSLPVPSLGLQLQQSIPVVRILGGPVLDDLLIQPHDL